MSRILRTAAPPLLAALLFSTAVTSHTRISTRLSWNGDVSRIIDARCASCHSESLVKFQFPINLSHYTTARPWARAIREVVLEGHGYSAASGAALTPFERELLVQWIDGGAPEMPTVNPADVSTSANRETSAGLNVGYTRLASDDPLRTLDEHQARLGGTKQIIPGLGLSLRAPDRIIVIERGAGPGERVVANGTIVPSLAAHLTALPPSTARTRISDAAYVIGPMDEPRTEVAEIAPDGPDRFWCPMHPDARSAAAGACPRCGMPFVEIPPLSLDAFALEVVAATPVAGEARLRLRVTRGASKQPVTDFLTTHERPFHLFVVDERLQFFAHVHPDIRGDRLDVGVALPASGRYRLIGDFTPVDSLPQLRMTELVFDRPRSAAMADRLAMIEGRLSGTEARAGRETRLTLDLRDPSTGQPPDLEPYLGAAAHLFVIDDGLREPMHAHPIDMPAGSLARPAFDVRFPRAGRYVMWLQVQRAGRVETLRFTADVSK